MHPFMINNLVMSQFFRKASVLNGEFFGSKKVFSRSDGGIGGLGCLSCEPQFARFPGSDQRSELPLNSQNKIDVGPEQPDQRTYGLTGFDALQLGSAFKIDVRQGSTFAITASGDRRNLDDLDVWVSRGTLHARYRIHRNRQYSTRFEITMPSLTHAEFSGASNATVRAFSGNHPFGLLLTGASQADVDVQATRADLRLSGAPTLDLRGQFQRLDAEASGASRLEAFSALTDEADVEATGASSICLTVAQRLKAVATWASSVVYRGTPPRGRPAHGGRVVKF